MRYSAAWTEFGCLISCSHEHKTVAEAASCIAWAGCYVIGVENGAMRSLTAEEEAEFECAFPCHSTDNPAVGTTACSSRRSSGQRSRPRRNDPN